jgi:isoleucyl-tRNA synthetase
MAPFTPFFAEYLYEKTKDSKDKESVHLENWSGGSELNSQDKRLIEEMVLVRKIVTLGLESRMKAKINVRQPLQKLTIKDSGLGEDLFRLIKDEVNVKEIIPSTSLKEEVILDINITPVLKEEGYVREFIRSIQDLRKKEGFNVGELIFALVDTDVDGKVLVEKWKKEIVKATQLKALNFTDNCAGIEIKIESLQFKVRLER